MFPKATYLCKANNMIMRLITTILLQLIVLISLANGKERHIVVSVNGLNIREKPGLESTIISKVPFGHVVKSDLQFIYHMPAVRARSIADTIDGVSGYWVGVEYQDIEGFAFSPYLFYNTWFEVDTIVNENTLRLAYEGFHLTELNYHPDLFWYGLYEDSAGFFLKKVDVTLVLSRVDGLEEFKHEDCFEYEGFVLETNYDKQFLFLIGSGMELNEGFLTHKFHNTKINRVDDLGFLYPERFFIYDYRRRQYKFRAYDSIFVDSECNINRRYQLEFGLMFTPAGNLNTLMNLSEYVNFSAYGKRHSEHKTPQILWVGDLTGNGYLDFILNEHNMVEHGGVVTTNSLFLSNIDENGGLQLRHANASLGSCY
jgi:hypothetical protein